MKKQLLPVCFIISALVLFLLHIQPASADMLYFGTSNSPPRVQKVNRDGTGLETLIDFGSSPPALRDIVVDGISGKMYFGASDGLLRRANLDGTGLEVLLNNTPVGDPFALDLTSGTVYFTGSNLVRINLDSSGRENLFNPPLNTFVLGIALDLATSKIYFALNGLEDRIMRANIDGSDVETLLSFGQTSADIFDIKLDVMGGKMYWTDRLGIRRANLDGTDLETVFDNVDARRLALDLPNGKIYWGSTNFMSDQGIFRANIDGNMPELVLSHDGDVHGLDFGPSAPAATPVPEPSAALLFIVGVLGRLCLRRRRFVT